MVEEHISRKSFVTRIWLEYGNNKIPKWRGHIQHVQGEEEGYFQNLKEMRDFLGCVSGVPGPALTAHPLMDTTKPGPDAVTDMKNED